MTYHFDNREYDCPFDCFIVIIKGKWRTSLLLELASRPCYFRELQRALPGISAKVLTENLQVLERNDLVVRREHATLPVTVEYALTKNGTHLVGVMRQINQWVDSCF